MSRITPERLAELKQHPHNIQVEEIRPLVEMALLSTLRTERPELPRVPPDVIWVQWSPVAGTLVKVGGPFAILDGARGKYRLVREGDS